LPFKGWFESEGIPSGLGCLHNHNLHKSRITKSIERYKKQEKRRKNEGKELLRDRRLMKRTDTCAWELTNNNKLTTIRLIIAIEQKNRNKKIEKRVLTRVSFTFFMNRPL
jgi:hypothetical protein